MKPDIHPDYVETTVTCSCGNTFTTRSTAKNGVIHADVCSQCHPFYTGKQKILDTGGRVARFEQRYGKRQRSRASYLDGAHLPHGRRAPFVRTGDRSMTTPDSLPALLRRARRSGAPARRPGRARRPGAGPAARPALRRADPGRGHRAASWRRSQGDLGAARELAGEDASFAAEATELDAAGRRARRDSCASCCCPRDPNDGKDVILEVKAGEGGEESALFAGDLLRMYLRYAERRGWKTEVLDAEPSPTSAATRTSPSRSAGPGRHTASGRG